MSAVDDAGRFDVRFRFAQYPHRRTGRLGVPGHAGRIAEKKRQVPQEAGHPSSRLPGDAGDERHPSQHGRLQREQPHGLREVCAQV